MRRRLSVLLVGAVLGCGPRPSLSRAPSTAPIPCATEKNEALTAVADKTEARPANRCASNTVEVSLSPDVATWICTGSVRQTRLPNGKTLAVPSSDPDACGRAAIVALVRNCTTQAVTLEDLSGEVRGAQHHAFAYWLASAPLSPGEERSIGFVSRGVGELTVTLRIGRGAAEELVRARARIQNEIRTTYE